MSFSVIIAIICAVVLLAFTILTAVKYYLLRRKVGDIVAERLTEQELVFEKRLADELVVRVLEQENRFEVKLVKKLAEQKALHEHGLTSLSGSIAGKLREKFCPFTPAYPYDIRDVVAVFSTFDFLVLKGRSNEYIEEVIIQEMKTGKNRLEPIQRSLRDCILSGKIRWEQWGIDKVGEWYLLD